MKFRINVIGVSVVAAAVLAACGGGGSSDPSVPAATAPITGSAAVGAAISGGAVTATCVSGNASTTTATDGSFTLSTSGLTVPCMLEITFGSPAQKLHSIATAAGRTNITPITELATALAFANSDLPSLYGTVTSGQLKLAATALSGASQQALTALKAESLTLPTGFDPIGGPLTPAAGQSTGDVHDQLLDSLKLKLGSAGQTLQSWVSSTVPPSTPPVVTPPVVTPAPVAATCAVSNLTTAAFNAIQLGMSVAQVNQTIGCAYNPASTQRLNSNVVYVWIPPMSAAMLLVWFDVTGTTVTSISNLAGAGFKQSLGF